MSALCKFVQVRVQLLQLNLSSGLTLESRQYHAMAQETVALLVTSIGNVPKLTTEQVTTIMQMILNSPTFIQEHIEAIRNALNTKLDIALGGNNSNNATKHYNAKYKNKQTSKT